MNDKNKKIWKIIIPILIVVTIAGIFVAKKLNSNANISTTENTSVQEFSFEITSINLERIKRYGVPVCIDFGSDSCEPCREIMPIMKKLNKEWQGKAAIQFMDIWRYTDGINDFPVSVIPTQVFFNADGTPYEPSETMSSELNFRIYNDPSTGKHTLTLHEGIITEDEMRKIFAEMGLKG